MTGNFASALDGVKVLDLTDDRGLYAGKLLADLGADVVKIEKPEGSKARRLGPFKDDVPGLENSLYFVNFNTNKRGVTLNLDSPAGRDIFKRLAGRVDVIIEDFEPGTMQSLGLGYPVLRELNQGLIMASVTGFGQTGPYSHYKAPDIVSFAMGGLMNISGALNEPPVVAPCEQAYHGVSAVTVFGIIVALYLRMNTGEGQMVDTSAQEAIAVFHNSMINYSITSALGIRSGSQFSSAPARIYPCKDGYVHIMVIRTDHWVSFLEVLGNPDILKDETWYDGNFRTKNIDILDTFVNEFTMSRTKMEITELCQARGIPCTPVNTPADFSKERHVKERGFVSEVEHPTIGRHAYLGFPYHLSQTPCQVKRPAPLLGQHNKEIYGGELGYTDEELARLKAEGII